MKRYRSFQAITLFEDHIIVNACISYTYIAYFQEPPSNPPFPPSGRAVLILANQVSFGAGSTHGGLSFDTFPFEIGTVVGCGCL